MEYVLILVDEHDVNDQLMAEAITLEAYGYGPLAIPAGQKQPPPKNSTGDNPLTSYWDWFELVKAEPHRSNLGARLPRGIVGVDVDAYDSKTGKDTWHALNAGDPFPVTCVISARFTDGYDGVSGIRLYRLPDGIDENDLWGAYQGVELIRHKHRYLMAPGATHPNGGVYQCLDVAASQMIDSLPRIDELPILTEAQALRLTKHGAPWVEPEKRQLHIVKTPRSESIRSSSGNDQPCRYMQRLADNAIRDIETYDGKHDRMLRGVYAMLQAEASGHQGAQNALTQLGHAFIPAITDRRAGGSSEAAAEYRRAIDDCRPKITPIDPILHACCNEPITITPTQTEIWSERAWLTWCHQTGLARGVSRTALLGAFLARVSAEISPYVKIETPIGGAGTHLNLFVLLVGASGTGKTIANGTISNAYAWTAGELRIGSGEGIAAAFTERKSKKDEDGDKVTVAERYAWRRYAWIDEYASLMNQKQRAGATIGAELRTAWSGDRLGMDYRNQDARLPVEKGTYRLSIAAGIQPSLAGDVFAGSDVGDLQRWLWFHATDPALAGTVENGEFIKLTNEQIKLDPAFALECANNFDHPGESIIIPISRRINAELWRDHIDRQAGGDQDYDAHRNHQRLRLAGVLSLVEGRREVIDADWELAGAIIDLSDQTRLSVAEHMRAKRAERLQQRGQDAATIQAATDEYAVKIVAERIWRGIQRHAQNGDHECTKTCATRAAKVPGETRDTAIEYAVAQGWLTLNEDTTVHNLKGSQPVVRVVLGGRRP
jgi:hypothetical protein